MAVDANHKDGQRNVALRWRVWAAVQVGILVLAVAIRSTPLLLGVLAINVLPLLSLLVYAALKRRPAQRPPPKSVSDPWVRVKMRIRVAFFGGALLMSVGLLLWVGFSDASGIVQFVAAICIGSGLAVYSCALVMAARAGRRQRLHEHD
jgi:hypothetical protein